MRIQLPTIETARLILRPFEMTDAPRIQELVSERDVALTTANIPHPYPPGGAEAWIAKQEEERGAGAGAHFAVILKEEATLIGSIGLMGIEAEELAELGYWIGKPYWGRGYCTEAGRAVLQFAFTYLGLNQVFAQHMARNPASGRVMQKIGMRYTGRSSRQECRRGILEDIDHYESLKTNWA